MTAALEGVSQQQHAPAALYPRERPGTPFTGGWDSKGVTANFYCPFRAFSVTNSQHLKNKIHNIFL